MEGVLDLSDHISVAIIKIIDNYNLYLQGLSGLSDRINLLKLHKNSVFKHNNKGFYRFIRPGV